MNASKSEEKLDLIYFIAWMMADWRNYFSKNEKVRKYSREQASELKPEICNPEITKEGLERRNNSLGILYLNFLYWGILLTSALIFITGVILRLPLELVAMSGSIGFYFSATSLLLSFRAWFTELDLLRYKRREKRGTLEGFKINRLAEPHKYDLIPGIFMAILFYFFLMWAAYL